MSIRNRIEVMHGVNLDQLGRREAEHYGTVTLSELERMISGYAAELAVEVRDLDLRLLDVAEVGHEAAHVGAHDRHPVGAREARQIAQVREMGDQEQVRVLLRQAIGDAVGTAHALKASLRWASASR